MNTPSSIDHPERVFPLSQGSSERLPIRPPHHSFRPQFTTGTVLGQAAFLRAWSARRAAKALAIPTGRDV